MALRWRAPALWAIREAREAAGRPGPEDGPAAAAPAAAPTAASVVDQLAKLATRTGEPKTRLGARLFTEAVMSYKPATKTRNGR